MMVIRIYGLNNKKLSQVAYPLTQLLLFVFRSIKWSIQIERQQCSCCLDRIGHQYQYRKHQMV